MTIRELVTGESAFAYAAMRELRPYLASEREFVRRVHELQRPQGYRLVAAVEDGGVSAVAGFRIQDTLAFGRIVYVDDLSTLPAARRRGAGMRISSHHFSREL